MVIASHWPSRRLGRGRSEPLRCGVAENIADLVRDHVRVDSQTDEQLRAANDLATVRARWEPPVLVGDFNNEPFDISLIDHLQASSELDRVVGPTNDLDGFEGDTADYRSGDSFMYNACWKFLAPENLGSFFSSTPAGEVFANRYQVLDQLVCSRGLLSKRAAAGPRQRRHLPGSQRRHRLGAATDLQPHQLQRHL